MSVFFSVSCHFKATSSYFQKDMIFWLSKYVKKVIKLFAFIFEQPSYSVDFNLFS